MLQWIRGKRSSEPAGDKKAALSEALPACEVRWIVGANLPIPDWSVQPWPDTEDDDAQHRHANGLAAAWLDTTIAALPAGYQRAESEHFMLLATLEGRPTRVLLDYLERSRNRVLGTLPGIATAFGHGKTVVMVFADEETYYHYIANYSASSQPEATSSGMFVDAGYGHFVFAQGPFETMEPVVVHELTHCMVSHLPIPAWLNEGLAVNTEHRFVPSRSRYRPNELQYMFGRFWDESTIQEFWSGKSFMRPDDGQPLSYELAKHLVQLLDKDYEVLARFCMAADREDAGEGAATGVLGSSLADLAAVVLGPGAWTPNPAMWSAGTEKGQF